MNQLKTDIANFEGKTQAIKSVKSPRLKLITRSCDFLGQLGAVCPKTKLFISVDDRDDHVGTEIVAEVFTHLDGQLIGERLVNLWNQSMESKPEYNWLIWSPEHGSWWRPSACGYTSRHQEAGRYSFEEAFEIVRESFAGARKDGRPPDTMVPEVK